jgi:hypothetical protein
MILLILAIMFSPTTEYFESDTIMVFNETIGQFSIFRPIKPKYNMHKLMTGLQVSGISLPRDYRGYLFDGGSLPNGRGDGKMYIFQGNSNSMSNAVAEVIFMSRPLRAPSNIKEVARLGGGPKNLLIQTKDGKNQIQYQTEEKPKDNGSISDNIPIAVDLSKVMIRRPSANTIAGGASPTRPQLIREKLISA